MPSTKHHYRILPKYIDENSPELREIARNPPTAIHFAGMVAIGAPVPTLWMLQISLSGSADALLKAALEWSGVLVLVAFAVFYFLVAAPVVHLLLSCHLKSLLRERRLSEVGRAGKTERRVVEVLGETKELTAQLSRLLANAEARLSQAEFEFKEGALNAFWNAIEKATIQMDRFKSIVKTLGESGGAYYAALESEIHTFPTYPAKKNTIPNPLEILGELDRLRRMADKIPAFANILALRGTDQSLIAGFTTLSSALENIGDEVAGAIGDLERSVTSKLAQVVEEEIRLRELRVRDKEGSFKDVATK